MACLESAIFSIDLDDDHIDDVIYQEGGDKVNEKKEKQQNRIQELLQKSRNEKLSKGELKELEQLKIPLDAEIKMQGRQRPGEVLKKQKYEEYKNQISDLLRSQSAPASLNTKSAAQTGGRDTLPPLSGSQSVFDLQNTKSAPPTLTSAPPTSAPTTSPFRLKPSEINGSGIGKKFLNRMKMQKNQKIKKNEITTKNMEKLKRKKNVRQSVFKTGLSGNKKNNSKSDSPAKPASAPTPTPAGAARPPPPPLPPGVARPPPSPLPPGVAKASPPAAPAIRPPPPASVSASAPSPTPASTKPASKPASTTSTSAASLPPPPPSPAKAPPPLPPRPTPSPTPVSTSAAAQTPPPAAEEDPLELAALELFKGQFLYYKEIEKLLEYITNLHKDSNGTKIKVMLHRHAGTGNVTEITMENTNTNILKTAIDLLNNILDKANSHLYNKEDDLDLIIPLIKPDNPNELKHRHSSTKFHVVKNPTERDEKQNEAERLFIKTFLEEENKPAVDFLDKILSEENLKVHMNYTMIFETFFKKLKIKSTHNNNFFNGVHPNALEAYKLLKNTFGLKDKEGENIDYIIETSLDENSFNISDYTSFVVNPVQRQLRYGGLFEQIFKRYIKKKGNKLSAEDIELLLKPELKLKSEKEKEKKQELEGRFNEDSFFKFLSEKHNLFYEFSVKSNEYQFIETKPVFDKFCNDNKSYCKTIYIPPFPFEYEIENNTKELEQLPEEFLLMIFNSISNLKNISLSKNKDIVKCRRSNKQIVTQLEQKLQDHAKSNKLDFSAFTKMAVDGEECWDILMKLIIFEQASTYYITKCISSKHNFLFHNTQKTELTGFWEKDKRFFIDNYSGSLVNNSLVGGAADAADAAEEEKADCSDKICNYKKHSIVYQLFEVVHKQFERLFGHPTEIENIEEIFNFKKIDDTVEQFAKETIEKKQNLLSNVLKISVKSVNELKKKQEQIKAQEEQAEKEKETLLSNVFKISVNMKQERDVKLLESLAGLVAEKFTTKYHEGESDKYLNKYTKKCLQNFMKQYKGKKINYDILYYYLNNPE